MSIRLIKTEQDLAPGDLRELCGFWDLALRAQGKSPNTIAVYTSALDRFTEYLVAHGRPTEAASIARADVEGFIAHLLETRSPATASNRHRALQSFWRFAVEEELVDSSPMRHMRPPAVPLHPVPILTEDDLHRLLDVCKGRTFEAVRDTAIIRLLWDSGMRRAELAGLTVDDVEPRNMPPLATVVGKGGRRRRCPFEPETAVAVERYLQMRKRHSYAASAAFLLGVRGPMTGSGVGQVLERIAEKAGVPGLHAHKFRHSFSHRWLVDGGTEGDLMRLNGWSSRSMLQRYAASAADERALDAYRKRSLRKRS